MALISLKDKIGSQGFSVSAIAGSLTIARIAGVSVTWPLSQNACKKKQRTSPLLLSGLYLPALAKFELTGAGSVPTQAVCWWHTDDSIRDRAEVAHAVWLAVNGLAFAE